MFEDIILHENIFLKKVIFSIHYPTEVFDNLIQKLNRDLTVNRDRLNQVDRNELPDEILREFNNEISRVKQNLMQQMNSLKSTKAKIQREKHLFENKEPVEFWNDQWENSPGLYWWRNHLCKYNSKIKYCRVKEELGKNTMRVKIISTTSPNYEVMYSSASNIKKGVKIFFGITLAPICAPINSIVSDKCEGKVTLLAYPKVLEPNVIPQFERQIQIIDHDISEVNNHINNLNSDVRNQITNLIHLLENQLQNMIRFKRLSSDVSTIWGTETVRDGQKRTKKDEISRYKNTIQYLYNADTQKYSISQFNNLFNIAFTANSLANTPITVENILSDASQIFI